MTKFGRIDDNPCDVLVVNRGPPSNPCDFGGVFSWFPFFWWIRSGAQVIGDGGASSIEANRSGQVAISCDGGKKLGFGVVSHVRGKVGQRGSLFCLGPHALHVLGLAK